MGWDGWFFLVGGKPGFRAFQLSPDLLSLTWQSKNKTAGKTKVDLKDIRQIRYGQRTDKFKRNNRPDLENLSFSIIYGRETTYKINITYTKTIIQRQSYKDKHTIIFHISHFTFRISSHISLSLCHCHFH